MEKTMRKDPISISLAILVLMAVSLGCLNGRKLRRSYEQKPFDTESWKNGDAIERGTMSKSLVGVQPIKKFVGSTKTEIIKTLGEPDKIRKDKIGSRDMNVLIYEIDLGKPEFMDALQIYLENDEKPVFVNLDVTREKDSLINLK
jgi:hypothetical protein